MTGTFCQIRPLASHLRPVRDRVGLAPMLAALLLPSSIAAAQLFERATVIRGARVVLADGTYLDPGDVLIKGEKIQEVGAKLELSFADRLTAKTIDGSGKTVTPGIIDAWSGLGRAGAADQPDATASAWDAFNSYAMDDFSEARQNGVTAVFLSPGGNPGIKGLGVVVQLRVNENGSAGKLLAPEAALCIDLGSEESAIARMRTFQSVRKKFRAAVDYRKSLEDYEEELKEYLEKLKERQGEKQKGEDTGKKGAKEESPPKEPEKEKPSEKPEPTPGESERSPVGSGDFVDVMIQAKLTSTSADDSSDAGAARKDEPAPPDASKKDGDDKKKEDEPKKPTKPKFDPASEMLLRAIDHKLPVRIEAHRSADILNALELADEYNLDTILEGGTDAYLVANRIAEADAPVVLGKTTRTELFEPNEFRRHREENAAWLGHWGVPFTIGTGGDPSAARFAAANAQLALSSMPIARDRNSIAWLRAVTSDAARVIGVGDRIGRLHKGMQADVVIWSGDPSDPASRVEQVLVAGKVVYPLPEN